MTTGICIALLLVGAFCIALGTYCLCQVSGGPFASATDSKDRRSSIAIVVIGIICLLVCAGMLIYHGVGNDLPVTPPT